MGVHAWSVLIALCGYTDGTLNGTMGSSGAMAPAMDVAAPMEAAGEEGRAAGGGFGVANPQGDWVSRVAGSAVGFAERYGWFVLLATVSVLLVLPRIQRLVRDLEEKGEAHRRREADLDKKREQARKIQAEAFEKKVREYEEKKAENGPSTTQVQDQLAAIEERAARLGLRPNGSGNKLGTGKKSKTGSYNPLMGGSFPRYRPESRGARGGGGG